MTTIYSGFLHLNGNLLASVDLETTGKRAGYHEPIQIAVVPLDSDLKPLEDTLPFYSDIRPLFPERAEKQAQAVHKLDMAKLLIHAPHPDKVADLLVEWWERLDLPLGKTLVPLAHNWPFESKFLQAWLGIDLFEKLFHGHYRDGMALASTINDKAVFNGLLPPFSRVGLGTLCNKFGIINHNPHDALADALAEAELYKKLCSYEVV